MAAIEIQFKEQVFFDIIAAQVLRVDPPWALVQKLPAGSFIERIDPHDVGWSVGTEVLFGDDEVAVKVPINIHVTNFAMAKAAGSLQVPSTIPVPAIVWLRLQGAAPSSLRWFIQRVEVQGQFVPIIAAPQTIGLGDLGSDIVDIRLAAGAGVVSIRLVTSSGGSHLGAVTNRLGGADWGQFIEGQVFADGLARDMNDAADGAAAGSSDPEIVVKSRATPHWDQNQRSAFASVGIVAVDAMPADIDVPVSIYAQLRIGLDSILDRMVLTTRISWFAHDFITDWSGGLITVVEDKVSETMLKKLRPPAGQKEIERGDNHVVLQGERPLLEPSTNLFRATVDQLHLSGEGVAATGRVFVSPRPMAFFTIEDQHWESHLDCTARQYKTQFHPPKVLIFNTDRWWVLRFVGDPTVDPAGFWVPRASWPGFQLAQVEFQIPPGGTKPVGQRSSGFIATTLGVRWVDLGAVPNRPPAPADPLGIQVFVISTCMAISDPWGMGIMNLEWLVDPPDLDLGLPPLREWTFVHTDVGPSTRVDLVGVGPRGERELATIVGSRGPVVVQVVTDRDESIHVRGQGVAGTPAPQMMQRWIVPWAELSVGQDARSLRLTEDAVHVMGRAGERRIALPPTIGQRSAPPAAPAGPSQSPSPAPDTSSGHARDRVVPRTAGWGRSVAVFHRGHAVVGVAGRMVPVSIGLLGKQTKK